MIPERPLRLQLIAILDDPAKGRLAALYDPDSDRLHLAAAGDTIGAGTVSAVDALFVELTENGGTRRLALDRPAPTDLRDILREASR